MVIVQDQCAHAMILSSLHRLWMVSENVTSDRKEYVFTLWGRLISRAAFWIRMQNSLSETGLNFAGFPSTLLSKG